MSVPAISDQTASAIQKASAGAVAQPLPPEQSKMASWIPPRQVWAGGVAAIVAWLILHALAAAGLDIAAILTPLGFDPAEVQTWLAGAIGLAIATWVPPSVADVVKNLNDDIVHLAQRDPKSNVSYVLPPVQNPPGEAPTIKKTA